MLLSFEQNIGAVSLRFALSKAKLFGTADVSVTAVCTSAEDVRRGDLYAAVVDDDSDGHDDIAKAVERGACAVLTERLVPTSVPVAIVKDTREAVGRLCHQLAGKPSRKMRTVAVSGSSGKTSVARLVDAVFRAAQQTVESWDDCSGRSAPLAAPEAAAWMHELTRKEVQNAVVELSSRELADRRPSGMEFDAAIITSICGGDVERHRTVDNYRTAQRRVIDLLKPNGVAVLNADEPGFDEFAAKIDRPTITFGLHGDAQVTATVLERHSSEQTFLIHAGDDCAPVRSHIIGDHHIRHCLAAAAIGLLSGIDLPTIAAGLESISALPGRLERLECGQPFSVFVDGAQTPHRLKTVLRAARQAAKGKVFCVIGCDSRLPEDVRPLLGRVAEKGADQVVLTSDNPGFTSELQIAHDMLDGISNASRVLVRPSRAGAIEYALQSAKPGDVVVIVGKGERCGQWVGEEWTPFDDRETAREMLYDGVYESDAVDQDRPQLRIFG